MFVRDKRQVYESVMIQTKRNHNLMNNKSEYNRCALPRLTTKLGEKDLEKWREEDKRELALEASIEEKIRARMHRTEEWSRGNPNSRG